MPRYSGWAEQRGLRGCRGLHFPFGNRRSQWLKTVHPTTGRVVCISGNLSGMNGKVGG